MLVTLLDLLTQLIRHAPIIAFVKDLEGRYRLVSQAWLEAFHTSHEAVVGKTDHELFDAAKADDFVRNDREVLATRTPSRRYEEVLVPPEVRTFFSTKFPVFDAAGALMGIAGFSVDVTDQRALLKELEQQKRFLERTQAVTDVGGWEYDDTTRTLVWTAETFRIFGVSPAEFTPTLDAALDFLAPEHREAVRRVFQRSLDHGTPFRMEVELMVKGRKPRLVRVHGLPERGVRRISGAIRDVTDEQEVEAQLRHTNRMDAVGQLAAGVAHDFNNMLGAITAAAELVKLEQGAHEGLEVILSASSQAAGLVRQLLEFGRKATNQREALDLHAVLDDVVSMLQRTVDRRIRLVVEKKATRTRLLGDAQQLAQAFINLALNARDAMSQGGTLRFRTRDETAELISIEVEDTGVGIPPDVLARIFDPFFTTKDRGRGTGLGLAAVDASVRGHDGSVTVRSEVGVGTTFELRFPVQAKLSLPAEKRPATAAAPAKADPPLVLLVDDEDLVRRSTERLVRRLGYRTLEARDGATALRVITEVTSKPALVMLDLMMPGLSARDTFLGVRQLLPDVPVLFCSGYAPETLLGDLLAQPRTHRLAKPWGVDDLKAALAQLLT